MTQDNPVPLPDHDGRLMGCPDDDLDGTHGYGARKMRSYADARVAQATQPLLDAAKEHLAATEAEARAERSLTVALENYTSAPVEFAAYVEAATRASIAEKQLRARIKELEKP